MCVCVERTGRQKVGLSQEGPCPHLPTLPHTLVHNHTHMYTHTTTHVHTCTHMRVHMYTQPHVYTHTCGHTCTHIHIHPCAHLHTCTHIHTHVHAHTHTEAHRALSFPISPTMARTSLLLSLEAPSRPQRVTLRPSMTLGLRNVGASPGQGVGEKGCAPPGCPPGATVASSVRQGNTVRCWRLRRVTGGDSSPEAALLQEG